jgi:hypothetical protein
MSTLCRVAKQNHYLRVFYESGVTTIFIGVPETNPLYKLNDKNDDLIYKRLINDNKKIRFYHNKKESIWCFFAIKGQNIIQKLRINPLFSSLKLRQHLKKS